MKGRLWVSIALTGIIFVVELAGGYLTNSLALMSDAVHVFMDVFALSLSLAAIYIAELPPTHTRTYGLHRVEVFVSWANSFILILITSAIFYSAYVRFGNPQPVESVGMLIVAVIGLVVNLIVALWLMGYAKNNLNVKSAFFHVVGDAAASVGVIVGAIIIYYTGWSFVDPLISDLIGAIILVGSFSILYDSSHILLEGVPKDIELSAVIDDIKSSRGIIGVHSIHVWSICHDVYALSAHLDIDPLHRSRTGEILNEVNDCLAATHHIFYTTLQAECSRCEMNDTLRPIVHREREHLH
ncbi:MAG: hypothetical protein A3J24_06940 [Deltaproteobacteria bacterium RIFCSPLOWO2_02_FULL_53_8]|nr:MAG: hypothetical protein A3J24_06940 [Deltaproteobacteria bacterium RIFCSPLOWO2_02_FULL_53_8]